MKNRWTPKVKGKNKELYCSPGCGGRCTKVAYDKAVNGSKVLCEKLGPTWEPRVWENMGWFYTARLVVAEGYIEIYPRKNGNEYWVDSRLPEQLYVYSNDPAQGVAELLALARNNAEKALSIVTTLERINEI